ncbi:hypothetical protein [Brevifollis gellanilyticus]|uniref:Peptidase S54 rhomboid domain-containing protein n=1 Tax=Brevifollis gellanilyticus TaxID=748831 RepID=A0A512MBM0_9BACT|nr:hypothetical protein [Brevifollis gellanilyticus]GEP44130.1 hypothetical protein BGE01nite_34210 [Brevifollis gellanilyticus]
MRFLDKLESRFGRLAVPGLMSFIALLHVGIFFTFLVMTPQAAGGIVSLLLLHGGLILHGQVWRAVSFIFVPESSLLAVVFGAMFLSWLGRGLEEAWGAFRLWVYFGGGMLAMVIGSMIFGYVATGLFLFSTVLLAFAMYFPNEEIRMYFFIPIKVSWLAWLDVAAVVLFVMKEPSAFWMVFFSHLNFLVTFGPGFIKDRAHMAKVGNRRSRFQEATRPAAAFFHQCVVCGKTDVDDPTLDFRVNDSGDEVCSICRKR